ncbi:hypothetical protein [Nodosilinea sp. FACHB-13]|nr:hypothetical protein [Nodosilinea sp. FACHB-13]
MLYNVNQSQQFLVFLWGERTILELCLQLVVTMLGALKQSLIC